MNKKILNETVFSIQGVNPGFNLRDEPSTNQNNHPPQSTPGKVVLKRLAKERTLHEYLFICCFFVIENNCWLVRIYPVMNKLNY